MSQPCKLRSSAFPGRRERNDALQLLSRSTLAVQQAGDTQVFIDLRPMNPCPLSENLEILPLPGTCR